MNSIEHTKFYSRKMGCLSKGCTLCVQGKKLVLFVTGVCAKNCYYCPLSTEKKNVDKVWANEWLIEKDEDLITEAKSMDARGAGITGGDPFLRLERTCGYIRSLKKEFGSHFHIHLYAPLCNVSVESFKMLFEAGLDEIRFHPDFDNTKDWKLIEEALKFKWDVGVEIPVVPDKGPQIKKLIDFLDGKIKFLNLNELEISETNAAKLGERNFVVKDEVSYAIGGSEELALKLMDYCQNKSFDVHYCTSQLKDKVQLANRVKRTSKQIARPFDVITQSGMLVRGAVFLEDLKPDVGYRKKIAASDKKAVMARLFELKEKIKKEFKIREDQIEIDPLKLRLITSPRIVKLFKGYCRAIIEEYPTHDQMEVELRFL